jgi:[CysO sulfur-carrier protein]-S-L-cysteine hydrolase
MTSDLPQVRPLEIPRDLLDAMVAHCQREAPLESCGVLGGVDARVSSLHPLRNIKASETRYLGDPKELVAAYVALRERGADILAIYHSHPSGEAIPSRIDLAENHYGETPQIIVSLKGEAPQVRIWQLAADSFEELPWRIIDPPDQSASA